MDDKMKRIKEKYRLINQLKNIENELQDIADGLLHYLDTKALVPSVVSDNYTAIVIADLDGRQEASRHDIDVAHQLTRINISSWKEIKEEKKIEMNYHKHMFENSRFYPIPYSHVILI